MDTLFPPSTWNAIPDPHPQGYMYGNNVLTMGSPAAIPPDMQAAAKAGTLAPSDQTSLNPSWAWAAGAGISTVADLATWVEAMAGLTSILGHNFSLFLRFRGGRGVAVGPSGPNLHPRRRQEQEDVGLTCHPQSPRCRGACGTSPKSLDHYHRKGCCRESERRGG